MSRREWEIKTLSPVEFSSCVLPPLLACAGCESVYIPYLSNSTFGAAAGAQDKSARGRNWLKFEETGGQAAEKLKEPGKIVLASPGSGDCWIATPASPHTRLRLSPSLRGRRPKQSRSRKCMRKQQVALDRHGGFAASR
jgi:hypothetical protein